MILDKSLILCSAQALSTTGGATDTMSTVLDLAAGVDTSKVTGFGKGDADCELFLVVTFTVAPTGSGTIDIQLRTHTATITAGVGTILWSSGAVAHTVNVVGKSYKLRIPRGLLRYAALQFVSSATLGAGTVDAQIVKGIDTNDM